LDSDATCSARLYLAASLTPYKYVTYHDKKNKEQLLVDLVIRESLKLGKQSHFLDGIPLLFIAADIIALSVAEADKLHPTSDRVGIGAFTLTMVIAC
jgi:tRNA nucleotidyltransferase (CCA-adding enzyme)